MSSLGYKNNCRGESYQLYVLICIKKINILIIFNNYTDLWIIFKRKNKITQNGTKVFGWVLRSKYHSFKQKSTLAWYLLVHWVKLKLKILKFSLYSKMMSSSDNNSMYKLSDLFLLLKNIFLNNYQLNKILKDNKMILIQNKIKRVKVQMFSKKNKRKLNNQKKVVKKVQRIVKAEMREKLKWKL